MKNSTTLFIKNSSTLLAKSGYMREINSLKEICEQHNFMLNVISQKLKEVDHKLIDEINKRKKLEDELDLLKFDHKLMEQKIRVQVEKNNMY